MISSGVFGFFEATDKFLYLTQCLIFKSLRLRDPKLQGKKDGRKTTFDHSQIVSLMGGLSFVAHGEAVTNQESRVLWKE
jgi:hypothetical protein